MATQRPVKVGSLAPGLNNRLEPTQLATVMPDRSKGTYLYAADNVDINDKGYVARRNGFALALAGNAHSLWYDAKGACGVINDNLQLLVPSGAGIAATTVRAGMPNLPLSYSRGADGAIYWSNGQLLRRIVVDDGPLDSPVVTLPPGQVPVVTVTTGALRGGQYLLAFTIEDADGESPATPVIAVTVPDNGGIAVQSAQSVSIYMSATDGDILTYQGMGSSVTLINHVATSRRCMTLNTSVMPAGQIVRHYNGQLLVAAGNILHLSLPYNYGITNPSKGYIPFPEQITIVQPTTNGVYICADKTYWIGDLMSDALQEVLPYGAILGTGGTSDIDETVFWQSVRGLIIADKNMSAKNVQEDALEIPNAASGTTYLRTEEGTTHIVASRVSAQPNVAAASTWIEAEIVRKETIL